MKKIASLLLISVMLSTTTMRSEDAREDARDQAHSVSDTGFIAINQQERDDEDELFLDIGESEERITPTVLSACMERAKNCAIRVGVAVLMKYIIIHDAIKNWWARRG